MAGGAAGRLVAVPVRASPPGGVFPAVLRSDKDGAVGWREGDDWHGMGLGLLGRLDPNDEAGITLWRPKLRVAVCPRSDAGEFL
jgi:hypothetical protein